MLNLHKSIILRLKELNMIEKTLILLILKLKSNLDKYYIVYIYYSLQLSSNNINELEKMRY